MRPQRASPIWRARKRRVKSYYLSTLHDASVCNTDPTRPCASVMVCFLSADGFAPRACPDRICAEREAPSYRTFDATVRHAPCVDHALSGSPFFGWHCVLCVLHAKFRLVLCITHAGRTLPAGWRSSRPRLSPGRLRPAPARAGRAVAGHARVASRRGRSRRPARRAAVSSRRGRGR